MTDPLANLMCGNAHSLSQHAAKLRNTLKDRGYTRFRFFFVDYSQGQQVRQDVAAVAGLPVYNNQEVRP